MASKRLYSTGSLSRGLDSHGIAHTVRDKDGDEVLPWGSNDKLNPRGLVWTISTTFGPTDLSSAEVHGVCIGASIAKGVGR